MSHRIRMNQSRRAAAPALALAAALMLAACAIARVDPAPPATAPAQFKEAGGWQRAAANGAVVVPVPDRWWTLFQDPVLDDLERRLVIGNETLQSAVAAVASARAAFDASRSASWPTLSAGISATRSASPGTGVTATAPNSGSNVSNNISLLATASWETDLWGRLAQARRGAQAVLEASEDDLAAARLSAQALLAQTYFSLRTAEAQLSLLDRSVAAYQRSLDLTQARYDGGVAARTDVLQAQTQLKTAQVQRTETTAQRAQLEHAVAVMLGVTPEALALVKWPSDATLPAPPAVPLTLPATLLERRPDIAAAQRRVASAYAQIGVADAAFFPALTVSANAGYRGATLASLTSAPNLLWSLGPSLTLALFDGGQRRLASAQARAAADQATSAYRQAVLTALQEVEDNLVLADQLAREAQLQQEALQAAQGTLAITLDQYRAGTVSYLSVVIAQTAALNSEAGLLALRNRQLAAVNVLLRNIAGPWPRTL